MPNRLRGKCAVVGTGFAGLGSAPGWTSLELLAEATARSLDDAGLALSDIDGICAATFYHFFPTLSVAEYLGIRPKWSDGDTTGGSSFMSQLMKAVTAIEAGLCETVLIAYGSNARSSRNLNGLIETPEFEQGMGYPVPMGGYAMAAGRHMHEFGTTRENLADVALTARAWAKLNPNATERGDLSKEEILSARMIADPLSKYDCCLFSDGGGALIVTSSARAKDLKQKPIYVLGGAGAHWHREIAQMPSLTTTCATESSRRAYEMAGVSVDDIDVVQLYDAFTINVILLLEDLGFCNKGEGGAFVSSGAIAPGGTLPVNTNGGGLSCVHPGAYGVFCMIEAIEQLRGSAGARQIADAEIAIAHGNGGTLSHQYTTVFGTETAL